MHGARLPFALGLVATALAIAFVLTRSPPLTAATNSVAIEGKIGSTTKGGSACQPNEVLPAHTTGVRLSLEAASGPRVMVKLIAQDRTIASGEHGPGWTVGSVTVPVRPLARAVSNVQVCVSFQGANETVNLYGGQATVANATHTSTGSLAGRMRVEYLRSGQASWWSLIAPVAQHMGLGRAWTGTWIAILVLALMAGTVVLGSWLVLRELR